jgi:condensin complex subunit 2
MSKTFDEGGAKGLLLANLGVSTKGCNIVFDSTLEEATPGEETNIEQDETTQGLIDISTLQTRIESVLGGQSLYQMPLVPQLVGLRQEHRQLKQEGFLEPVPTVSVDHVQLRQNALSSTAHS